LKRREEPLVVPRVILATFSLLETIKAVIPPPDGGYPGGNTAEGQNALFSLTSGGWRGASQHNGRVLLKSENQPTDQTKRSAFPRC
jgi:hypothetical protein